MACKQGQLRLLTYTNDSKNLFFTTSLQNSVQSYSVKLSKLLEESHTHPSPPTCLGLSSTSHLLLSTSATPPTIRLQNLTLRTPPLDLRPRASAAAVVALSFHPERPNVFLLAFANGVLAAYDATRLLRDGAHGENVSRLDKRVDGEIGHFRGLHALGTQNSVTDPGEEGSHEIVVGDQVTGITAVTFIPGFRARAISVGSDGKCCLVDFEGSQKKRGATVVKTWHLRAPATSLSVIPMDKSLGSSQLDGTRSTVTSARERAQARAGLSTKSSTETEVRDWYLAVGRIDGKVLIFNSTGTLLGEKIIDSEGGRVIDVEWVDGVPNDTKPPKRKAPMPTKQASNVGSVETAQTDGCAQSKDLSPNKPPRRLFGRSKPRKSLSSLMAAGREIEEQVIILDEVLDNGSESLTATLTKSNPTERTSGTIVEEPTKKTPERPSQRPISVVSEQAEWEEVDEPQITNYMSLFSPVKGDNSPAKLLQPERSMAAPASETRRQQQLDHSDDCKANTAPETSRRQSPTLKSDILPCCGSMLAVSAPVSRDEKLTAPKGSGMPKTKKNGRRVSTARRTAVASSTSSAHAAVQPKTDQKTPAQILAEIMTASDRKDGLALFAPYMKKNVMKESPATAVDLTTGIGSVEKGASKSSKTYAKPLPSLPQQDSQPVDVWLEEIETVDSSRRAHSKSTSSSTKKNKKAVSFTEVAEVPISAALSSRSPRTAIEKIETPSSEHIVEMQDAGQSSPYKQDYAPTALQEVHHNIYRPSSPSKPSKTSPTKASHTHHSSPSAHLCVSQDTLRKELSRMQTKLAERNKEDMRNMQVEMLKQFQTQKRWIEGKLDESNSAMERLMEENRRLTEQLRLVGASYDR
jgi:WD40 repeat protein